MTRQSLATRAHARWARVPGRKSAGRVPGLRIDYIGPQYTWGASRVCGYCSASVACARPRIFAAVRFSTSEQTIETNASP